MDLVALEKGFRIKLLSRAERIGDEVVTFVAPHFIQKEHPGFNVDNEFNTVIVEALFSDRQNFVGKGAGSHPTASAVLSDISALKYDYKYEYKRSQLDSKLKAADDVLVKIYLGSSSLEKLNGFNFEEKTEVFQGSDYKYITGWILYSNLRKTDFNKEKELFFAVLPEDLKATEEDTIIKIKEAQLV